MSATPDLPSGLVTFLFTDIEGSTRLAQLLGREYRPVLAEHRQILRRALGAGDGVALFTEGDSVFAAFPDASAAICACVEAQRALAAHAWPRPERQAPGTDGAALRLRRARWRRVRHAGGAPGGPGRLGGPRRSGALLRRPRRGWPPNCPTAPSLLDLGLYQLRGFDGRERLFQLIAPGLEREFPRPRTLAAAPHNLPAPAASFVGRAGRAAAARALLERTGW